MTTNDYLAGLAPYARVRVGQYGGSDDTWSANAILRINAKGGEFKITSGFNHPSAKAAAKELLERVLKVVNQASDLKRLDQGDCA
jgi:hypothetical protein